MDRLIGGEVAPLHAQFAEHRALTPRDIAHLKSLLAMLLPARVVEVSAPAAAWGAIAAAGAMVEVGALASGLPMQTAPGGPAILCALWLGGVVAAFAHLVRSQLRFTRAARMGRGGPAVVGVLRPRVVTPADFLSRYTPREQSVVLAHEQTHIARQDS